MGKGLVTNYGEGALQTAGGAHEVLPLQKERGRRTFSRAEGGGGGHNKFWGVFAL